MMATPKEETVALPNAQLSPAGTATGTSNQLEQSALLPAETS